MNYAKAYVGAVCLASLLRPILGDAPMVAIWLPPGRGGALANIALALLGKIVGQPQLHLLGRRASARPCGSAAASTSSRPGASPPGCRSTPGPASRSIYLDDLLPKVVQRARSCGRC